MEFQLSNSEFKAILARPFFTKRADHVLEFSAQHNLFTSKNDIIVSLSGGADSVFLLLVMKFALESQKISRLRIVHFNHGNRAEQKEEAMFVEGLCHSLGVPLKVIDLNIQSSTNFESTARKARYEYLKNECGKNTLIALGQHIDDSFEWSLMQQFKSSSLDPILGIPLINEKVIRPLMCKASKQIRFALKDLKVPYLVDPTNEDISYERNFVRKVLIPKIAEKYPSYLKNYINRSNKLAHEFGSHRMKKTVQQWKRFEDRFGGIGIYCLDPRAEFVGGADWLIDLIKEISHSDRGALRDQIDKMITAQSKGKKGPMKFSGGVYGFMEQGLFYFIHTEKLPDLLAYDETLSSKIGNTQIPAGDSLLYEERWLQDSVFPFLFCSSSYDATSQFGPGLKKSHFLFPKTTQVLLEKGIYFQSFTRAMSYRKSRPLAHNVSFSFVQNFDQH